MDYFSGLKQMGVDEKTARIFMRYHGQNPWIWPEIEKRVLAQINAGGTHVGVKGICEDIRKECHHDGDPFAVNNKFPSYYARIFILKYPHFKDYIELRVTKGLSEEEELDNAPASAMAQQPLLNVRDSRRFEYA